MEMFFLSIAAVGGTLLVCQFLLGLLGLGDHGGDIDHSDAHIEFHGDGHDHGGEHGDTSAWFFGMLSFRAIAAALAFFGLTGLAAHYGGMQPLHCVLIAVGSGLLAMYVVATMMKMLAKLKADGSIRMDRAVGVVGTVYLRIPGRRAGAGKVTLILQNRTVECQAVTSQDDIPTGTRVTVVALAGPDTVEVVSANVEKVSHV